MKRCLLLTALLVAAATAAFAQVPENLVVDGVPPASKELKADVGRYLEFRTAALNGWHPVKREMLVATRFADTIQLHEVRMPGGARRQLTFTPEPAHGGGWQPRQGHYIIFSQDAGGGEFYQYYRLDPDTGRITLLTDGKSRNGGGRFSRSGNWFAYTSTRRNGRDTDLYVMDPADPKSDRRLCELAGGGWTVAAWAPDDSRILVGEHLSINESYLHLVDAKSGTMELLTPRTGEKVAWGRAQFAGDGKSFYVITDKDSEFQRLCRFDLASRQIAPMTPGLEWNVEEFDVTDDGKTLAFVSNEEGQGVLHLMDARTGRSLRAPKLPAGVVEDLGWHENSRDLGFTLSSARSPGDCWSLDVKTGKLERWTESETGGLNPANFPEPELVKVKGADGLQLSGFLYRPDPARFPGRRPVIVNIHGGPESQSRPLFQGRNNYYLTELGVAILYPNVRGSSGYGKNFLTLDNGLKREDSVRDIGAFLDWIALDPLLDRDRIAVMGGSYGGFMTLASMTHFSDRLRCGVDVVGISSFLTFLKNTQDYRRDLRRAEYGDERDPQMAEFLQRISPLTSVEQIRKPLFVVQGRNDPRVPMTEAEQMVKAIRERGGVVWYLMARDEGHGFQKKKNADFQFISTIQFLREHLLR